MHRQDRIPTQLHYAIRAAGDRWVLTCEGVPISCFEILADARRAAAVHILAARRRGDCPILENNHEDPVAA